MRNTFLSVWMLIVVVWPKPAEAQLTQLSASTDTGPYIVPDAEAMETKRQLLGGIKPIKREASHTPTNVALTLADDLAYADTGVYG